MIKSKFKVASPQEESTAHLKFTERVFDKENSSDKDDLFRLVIEHLPDQVYLKDTRGQFILCNTPVAQNAGCAIPEEVIGKTDFDFYPVEVAERFLADEKRILKSAVALINHEEQYADKQTNEIKWNLTTKIPIRDEADVVIGLLGINRDITDIKNALLDREKTLADLQQRNRELEEFTHIVSHKLRSPVANILGLLALATEKVPHGVEDNSLILEKIAVSAKRLDEMIHELNRILQDKKKGNYF
ncbi:MAG TPA: PAS domain-containing protein [Pedobacter sp.]